MASRDIANMHLFLDLKKKFPDLPDDILRKYVYLYAEDQDRCINLLQRESENHYHPSQPFSDFRLPESKTNARKNEGFKILLENQNDLVPSYNATTHLQNRSFPLSNEHLAGFKVLQPSFLPSASSRSTSHAGVIHRPEKNANLYVPSKPEPHSAPVIPNHEKPFADIYKQAPVSSHATLCQSSISDDDNHNRMMFSTTKEHIIPPLPSNSEEPSKYFSVSSEEEQSKRHAVRLSITPSFPFHQQHINVFNNAVCAPASHSSRPGRHTTSVNFQLQPQSSDQCPLEISTIPTNIGEPCNYRDFGSHIQISVGSQGATFTAVRLQRPHPTQNQQAKYNSAQYSTEQVTHDYHPSSSHAQNSKAYGFPSRIQQAESSNMKNVHMKTTEGHRNEGQESVLGENLKDAYPHHCSQGQDSQVQKNCCPRNSKDPMSFARSFQTSPDYIQAVKSHQLALLDIVCKELEEKKSICSQLKSEVNMMEQEMMKRTAKDAFSYVEELKRLREENRKLRIECNCLLMEFDMCNAGQIPLGVTDEDFYSNIFTGPNGAIASSYKGVPNADKGAIQTEPKQTQYLEEEEEDERNRWKCKSCTFANHPALEKCEMCELPKDSGSFFSDS